MLAPNVLAKPDTVMFNKVTIKGARQAVQMFGPAQAAVAKAVVDSVADGTIPKAKADDLCVIVGVFIHWQAADNKKIYDYNYQATKESITRAMKNQPSMDEVLSKKDRPSTRSRKRSAIVAVPGRPRLPPGARGRPGRFRRRTSRPPAPSPARQRPPVTCPSGMLCIAQRARSSRTTRGGAN